MNFLTKFAALIYLPIVFFAGCADAQNVRENKTKINSDLTTDEAVLAELQKIADARREKLGLANKGTSKLEAKNVCIERLKESAKIIVIGFFATDIGCRFDGAFVDSQYFEKTDAGLSKAALDALGWEKSSQTEREKFALLWVEKGFLAFFTVLNTKPKELENQAFHPPKVVSGENGEIKITLWIQLPSGMRREKGFQHVEYRFAKDGSFSGSSTLESLAV